MRYGLDIRDRVHRPHPVHALQLGRQRGAHCDVGIDLADQRRLTGVDHSREPARRVPVRIVLVGIVDQARTPSSLQHDTGRQAVEVVAITMLVYLVISLATSLIMNLYNRRMALVER